MVPSQSLLFAIHNKHFCLCGPPAVSGSNYDVLPKHVPSLSKPKSFSESNFDINNECGNCNLLAYYMSFSTKLCPLMMSMKALSERGQAHLGLLEDCGGVYPKAHRAWQLFHATHTIALPGRDDCRHRPLSLQHPTDGM